MGAAAVVTVWPPKPGTEVESEAVEEEEEIGFMVESQSEQFAEEENEPLPVASALLVKEVADALKSAEKEETEVDNKTLLEQLKDIFVLAGPALGIWLSGPIMGIIATAVIGQSISLELAALGPRTVLCDSVCYVIMFLSVATSNLVATSLAQKDREEAARHLSRTLFLALTLGLGLSTDCYRSLGDRAAASFCWCPELRSHTGSKNIRAESDVAAPKSYVDPGKSDVEPGKMTWNATSTTFSGVLWSIDVAVRH